MSRNLWMGLIASVLIVVVAVGLLRLLGDDDVDLPDTLGDLVATDAAAAYPDRDEASVEMQVERQARTNDYNREQTSEAFGGADVDVRTYASVPEYDRFVTVLAVADDAGALIPGNGFADPEVMGYALPQVEWSSHGDVECLGTRVQPPRAADGDYTEAEAEVDVVTCQRRTGSLTVRVSGASGSSLDDVVDLTEQAWAELS